MNRTDVLLRKALKKIDMLEKRIEKLEPPKQDNWPKYDGDGKSLDTDIHGNEYDPKKAGNNGQHDFQEDDYDWDTAGSL